MQRSYNWHQNITKFVKTAAHKNACLPIFTDVHSWGCVEEIRHFCPHQKCNFIAGNKGEVYIGDHRLISLHSPFVSSQEMLAVGAFVSHGIEGVNTARDAGAWPKSHNTKDSGQNPCHDPRFRFGCGPDLALAVRAHHVNRPRAEVGLVHHHNNALLLLGRWGSHLTPLRWRNVAWRRRGSRATRNISGSHTLGGVLRRRHWRRRHCAWHEATCSGTSIRIGLLSHGLLVGRRGLWSCCVLVHSDLGLRI